MEYIAGNTDFKIYNSAVTLGKFDGLHLGHQYLMEQVISFREQGYTAVMFSFLYHPFNLLSNRELELIYTEEEKYYKLNNSGMDVLVSYPFTEDTKNIEPEAFIKEILVDKLGAKIIVVGKDFHFGHNRKGDIHLLKSLETVYGYKVIACDKKRYRDIIVSSSVIRKELKAGNMEIVNAMLGQPYSILGVVQHGRKIGRTLGMPTTNLIAPANKLLPPCGVYASKTIIDGINYIGVTNIGYKPTISGHEKKGIETFLFDFDRDLYGKAIEVELFHYQRRELKLNSLEELKLIMQEDIVTAKKFFGL
ncbi:MAG TPA: bifunctional riboflavin kinase/FAD synthetase [Mobilitalea sp.]|nr:bifunctional riboflavin kinase/FAD synthetase [Mobilitalea sp.]